MLLAFFLAVKNPGVLPWNITMAVGLGEDAMPMVAGSWSIDRFYYGLAWWSPSRWLLRWHSLEWAICDVAGAENASFRADALTRST